MEAKKQTDRTPNWNVWKNVPRLKLWEAVALSLNIDPKKVRFHRNGWMAGPGAGPMFQESAEFDDRILVAKANLSTKGPLVPAELYAGVLQNAGASVSLAQFGEWAASIGWTLPDQFPKPSKPAETADQRHQRLAEEKAALIRSGHKSPNKTLAEREGVSKSRMRQLTSGVTASYLNDPFGRNKKSK